MASPIHLSSRPVFGYEYSTCNANERRVNDMRKDLTVETTVAAREQTAKVHQLASNVFKVLGAFVPLVGAARIVLALLRSDEQTGAEALRGLAELLGAGLFMIAIDLAVTVYREYSARHPDYMAV